MPERALRVPTAAGDALAATAFLPDAAPRAAVLVAPAMGVDQGYYAPLCAWLAAQGYAALSFDYSGMGASRTRPLPEVEVDVLHWAYVDCAAMVDAAAEVAPGRPLLWVGHSLGGQVLGLVPNRERVARAVTVAAGSGYWRENAPGLRWKVWWLWYCVAPLSIAAVGYFPGRRLGMVGDLPAGVMRQWREWCLDRDYLVGVLGDEVRERYAALRLPLVSLSFTDDEFMSERNIRSLHGFYAGADLALQRIAPAEVGAARIGHFGFFRAEHAERLWRAHLLPALSG
jgi:predicted alpha/beta hydrolase